ncbi:trimethyltridecatetraene synthase-like [Salvia miltiorrhiza]|uniref:trimethyltridecatetraene synthase-like n=1 Tax=Salvia miltiorrhiza TaxID=226208 RepID=UPI0025ABC653|nr:trimethyltridecatetraene synthase-like [Salvia miltiorrhiza]
MEIPWLLLGLISAAAAAFISKIIKSRGWRPEQKLLPPGPKPWPIIGNLNLLGSTPHRSLHHLSQKYGEIMLLKLGKFPVVVASSPEMARQFLKVHDAAFASRPTFAAYKHVSFEYSDVAFSPYGPYWREVRKIAVTKVLSARKIGSFEHTRVEERRLLLSRLKSLSGKPVELREHLLRFTLSIICKMLFKEDSIVDMDEVSVMVREWFLLNGAFNIGDWIPWLDSLDLQGYIKKMKALRKKMDRFCDSVIDDHLAKRVAAGDDAAKKDFVDALLQIAAEEDGVEFTMDCVKALIMNMLVAATDTSASVVEWAIHEILKQPHIIEKAKAEMNNVIGRNRWVEESDSTHLPYINAIIMETMRLHPIATLLAPHCAIEDCNVAGYNISKGTVVFVNAWSIGRDPGLWDAPAEFLPERFVGKDIEMITGIDFAILPFGSGRRKCPGINLALKTVPTMLANLLHGFELKLEKGMRHQDISMEEQYGLTTIPQHPISIIMEPTLPTYLY